MKTPSPRAARVAAWIIGIAIVAGLIWYTADQARQRDYDSCRQGNEFRQVFRTLAIKIIDDDGQRTPGEKRILVLINENVAPRDCEALR